MSLQHPIAAQPPIRLESPSGLIFQLTSNGSIRRLDHRDVLINLFPGSEAEGGPANLYLRRLREPALSVLEEPAAAVPLLGPRSPGRIRYDGRRLSVEGEWAGIRFGVSLILAEAAPAWFWHVALENTGRTAGTVELIYAQDLGLAHYGAVRLNEYYVSQYLDHTPLPHPSHGVVLASRQNLAMGGCFPWAAIGSLNRARSFATDALQFYGLESRAGRPPRGLMDGLPGTRRQHEHAMAVIQDAPLTLAPGEASAAGFFGWFEPDHPEATSGADLAFIDRALSLPEAAPPAARRYPSEGSAPSASLFSTAPLIEALELDEAQITGLFGGTRREPELEHGRLLSFFTGDRSHVVLRTKEFEVLRPHGHILRTGSGLVPDEAGLTSTVWMAGVFHSMVTQGHVSINRFLSTTHTYLSLFRAHGQRLFIETGGCWRLLDVPSAFEMTPEGCRWIYKHAGGLLQVRSEAATGRHELSVTLDVLEGPPVRCLLSNHVALNGDDGAETVPAQFIRDGTGFFVRPVPESDVGRRFPDGGFRIDPLPGTPLKTAGGDELLYADGRSRREPFLCLVTAPVSSAGFRITGHLVPAPPATAETGADRYWREMTAALRVHPPAGSDLTGDIERLQEILPWFAHDALIHYLSPRGLEQYSGGGWGVRDVCQGPVEMLLALGRFEPVRDLLCRVFSNQNPDGDWPQWFMFFERERNIRPGDSHGDIVFWPVLALAQYLLASGDGALLGEVLPFFHPEGGDKAERGTLWEHVERALQVVAARTIPGTRLAAYGHGDWNDSLQPVDPAMREKLCSVWTVTLHYQTLTTLAEALRLLQRGGLAAAFDAAAAGVREDFQRLLIVDGIAAGYAHFREDGEIGYLVHPRDQATGLSYSLLPMIHAITNGLLTPEQAARHLQLIDDHLLGPDGARLFDRPMAYRGGPQKYFQRAESSSFFGREIGLMYTHAHLRYAEALAVYGDAERFFRALCKANPIGIRTLVPAATLRQANCYYSSSDAAFADRYQAYTEYDRVRKGEITLEGGWRVYSSGSGIGIGLILRGLLGLRLGCSKLVVDPVIPKALDGLRIELDIAGDKFEVIYSVRNSGSGPLSLGLNGSDLPFSRATNPYRTGGAEVALDTLRTKLTEGRNRLTVALG
jgi:cellobiose phosphorylase